MYVSNSCFVSPYPMPNCIDGCITFFFVDNGFVIVVVVLKYLCFILKDIESNFGYSSLSFE